MRSEWQRSGGRGQDEAVMGGEEGVEGEGCVAIQEGGGGIGRGEVPKAGCEGLWRCPRQ